MSAPAILIVDDEIIIAREQQVHLLDSGYAVAGIASSGPEAIRMAMDLMPDLILMDVVLKGDMDGVEAAAQIRRLRQVPIIFLTAHTDAGTLERARVTEPSAYMVKPFSERELSANIEMALYRHRAESRLRSTEHPLVALGSEIAAAVATPAGLRDMLDRCARAVVTNLDAALVRIWVLDSRGGTLTLEASTGIHDSLDGAHSRVPVGQHDIGLVAQERRPHVTNDLAGDPRASDPEWARRERLTSFAGLPLLIGKRLIGVMAVFARQPFSHGTLEALGSVASAVAVGIERNRLEEQLRNGQKLEAIGQLAGGVAHDFNNILTVITGYTELLLRRPGLDEFSTNLLREIGKAGDRATGLTRQLLAFSRRQVLEARVLDLNALVTDLEKMLRRLIGEDIVFTTRLDPSLAAVKADAGQIEQVIMNLAVNARDSMPQGGSLRIETANVELDADRARAHPDLAPGAYVKLSVSDQGCGMTPEVISRIFEPFFTTKGPGKGTGLGLSTVYGIVKQSGGHVAVSSRLGAGTTFEVYIPRAKEVSRPRPHVLTPRFSLRASSRGGETILLVEDEGAVRAFAREVLVSYGYTILEAAGGREALLVAGRSKDPIDLLLTDVIMPEMAGRSLTNALSSGRPAMRVLYMSGYTDDEIIRRGVLVAGTNFIHKPFTPDALALKVREILDRKRSGAARLGC